MLTLAAISQRQHSERDQASPRERARVQGERFLSRRYRQSGAVGVRPRHVQRGSGEELQSRYPEAEVGRGYCGSGEHPQGYPGYHCVLHCERGRVEGRIVS